MQVYLELGECGEWCALVVVSIKWILLQYL
jgi:hypothetical protein